MSILGHIFYLTIGGGMLYFIFKDEKQRYNTGKMGRYVKVRKANCSEQDFIARLRLSILKSFMIRFVFFGILAFVICAYIHFVERESLDDLGGFSAIELLVMWVSFSMIAMADRSIDAKWNRF